MRRRTALSLMLLLSLLTACQQSDLPTEEVIPLSFSMPQTREGLSSLFDTFRVWGTCITEGGSEEIMPDYRVNYHATEGWTYSIGEGTEAQTLHYWDPSASRYHFHAGAPAARVAGMTASSLTLTMTSTTALEETALYSQPHVVKRTDTAFGEVVNLNFTYAHARVNLAFKYQADAETSITRIQLIPPSPYATEGTLQMEYDWAMSTVSSVALTDVTRSSEVLTFPDVKVPAQSAEAVQTAAPWYMIPDPSATGRWKVHITVGGQTKEVEFTVSEQWKPGRSYLYRFEYTADANLVFVGTDTELFIGEDPEDGGTHNFN